MFKPICSFRRSLKGKTSRKTDLRDIVISGQYILKGMNCFEFEAGTLEPKTE